MALVTQSQIDSAGDEFAKLIGLLVDKVSNKEQLTQMLMGTVNAVSGIAAMDIPPQLRVAVASRLMAVVHKRLNDQLLPLTLPPAPPVQ